MVMNNSRTDRYVRNKLTPAEVEAYELQMMDSPELQDELEEALLLKEALKLGRAGSEVPKDSGVVANDSGSRWMPWALAASVTLMLVSSYLYVSNWSETKLLKNQLASLSQPRSEVLFATVKIMRSAGNAVPDSIIQLPERSVMVMLEIELGSRSRNVQNLLFSFESEGQATGLNWIGSPDASGLTTVAINSEQIPLGMVWLVVSASDGEVLERRLLEFRASDQD